MDLETVNVKTPYISSLYELMNKINDEKAAYDLGIVQQREEYKIEHQPLLEKLEKIPEQISLTTAEQQSIPNTKFVEFQGEDQFFNNLRESVDVNLKKDNQWDKPIILVKLGDKQDLKVVVNNNEIYKYFSSKKTTLIPTVRYSLEKPGEVKSNSSSMKIYIFYAMLNIPYDMYELEARQKAGITPAILESKRNLILDLIRTGVKKTRTRAGPGPALPPPGPLPEPATPTKIEELTEPDREEIKRLEQVELERRRRKPAPIMDIPVVEAVAPVEGEGISKKNLMKLNLTGSGNPKDKKRELYNSLKLIGYGRPYDKTSILEMQKYINTIKKSLIGGKNDIKTYQDIKKNTLNDDLLYLNEIQNLYVSEKNKEKPSKTKLIKYLNILYKTGVLSSNDIKKLKI